MLLGKALKPVCSPPVAERPKSGRRLDRLADRLARLTHLCSEIHNVATGKTVPTERLEETLKEAEDLCRELRAEIKRRKIN